MNLRSGFTLGEWTVYPMQGRLVDGETEQRVQPKSMDVLLALAGLFEFISQLEDTRGNYGVPQALLFTFLRLPQLAFEMLPIAALIGSLLGLGGLANNSELVVMRTAG